MLYIDHSTRGSTALRGPYPFLQAIGAHYENSKQGRPHLELFQNLSLLCQNQDLEPVGSQTDEKSISSSVQSLVAY